MPTKKEPQNVEVTRSIKREVELSGLTPIMFDRYSGSNKEELEPMDKCYINEQNNLVLPSLNLISFLSAQNTESATQRVIGRGWKEVAKCGLSYVTISPMEIQFLRNKKPIERNEKNVRTFFSVGRIMKGKLVIPHPQWRPILDLDWSLKFTINLQETPSLNEARLKRIFEIGGNAIGLGSFRGVYGKFAVTKWE